MTLIINAWNNGWPVLTHFNKLTY